MKNLFAFALITMLVTLTANAVVISNNNDVAGEWEYEVPSAPYGYQKGVLSITEKENELAGEVKFADGYKIKLRDLSYEEDTLKAGLYIDYEYISIKVKITGEDMKGTVNSPEGNMTLTAKKVR
jgi:hypothetical protein